jgi:hypothetical protein
MKASKQSISNVLGPRSLPIEDELSPYQLAE